MANVYGLIFEIDDKTKAGASSINRNLDKISGNADRVKKALGGIGSVASSAVGALGKTAAAATAAAGAFAFLAKKNLDSLDALGKTATKLGVTTNFLSEYSFVADQAGLSTDQFQTGLQRFLRRLGQAQQGTGELLKPLQRLGISMKDSNGNFREGTEVFEEFLTKLDGTTNSQQKLALAMGAFDTEGVAFINMAEMGAKEIANLRREAELAGLSIDERLTEGAARAKDALGKLIARAQGFGAQFFGSMAPAIETLADDLKAAIDEAVGEAGGMEAFATDLASRFISGAADLIRTLGTMFDGFTNSMATVTNVIKQLLVSLSPVIPNFEASFGDPGTLAARKSELEDQLKRQNALYEEQKAKIAELREQYDALDTNFFGGKKDPDNIMGQIISLSRELGNMGMAANHTQSQIDDLGNTFVFEKMATDAKSATENADKLASKLEETASSLRTLAAEQARENEIRQKYPYSEHADAITRLAAAQKRLADATGDTGDKNDDLNGKTGNLLSTLVGYNKFLNDLVVSSQNQVNQTNYAQRAMDDLNEMFRMGRISGEAYSAALKVVKQMLGEVKEDGEDTKNSVSGTINEYQQFLSRIGGAANTAANEIIFATRAKEFYKRELDAGRISIDNYAQAMILLKRITGEVKDETEKAAAKISPFNEFLNRITGSARKSSEEVGFAAKAKSYLRRELDAGRMSIDVYARSMEQVNAILGLTDDKADDAKKGIEGLNGALSGYNKFLQTLIDNANQSITTDGYLASAKDDLNEMFRMGRISGEAYSKALEDINRQLGIKPDGDKGGAGIDKIKTLSDLQKALATDSQQSAANMALFKEYLASGSYSAQELQDAMSKLGISMDELPYDQFKEVFEQTVKSGAASTNNLKKLQGELNKLVENGIKLTETQKKMLDQVNEQLGTETFNVAETLENKFKNMIGTVSNTFADVLLGLKDGFTSLEDLALQSLRMIISTLIEAFIRSVILKQSLSFGGGGFFGALLGGLAALNPMTALIGGAALIAGGVAIGSRSRGGPVGRDKSYLVGERGPEIFTPNQAGNITSNEEMNANGAGDLAVNFTINAIDTQTGVQFLLENKRVITGVIQEAYMRRGTSGPLG